MAKTAVVHTRVEPELKEQAENVFRHLGITTSDAVNMLLSQVVLRRGLPFEVAMPERAADEEIAS